MDYTSFCIIIGIMFWVLAALCVVAFMAWVYCYVQYYKWDKEDRNRNCIIKEVQETIRQTIEDINEEQYEIGCGGN